jgi:hypothetical protein
MPMSVGGVSPLIESWLAPSADSPGRRTAKTILHSEHWMRSRAGMSAERAKRSFWPQPGQVAVKDEAVAEC